MKLLPKFFLAILLLTVASASWAACIKWDYKGEFVEELSDQSSTPESTNPNDYNIVAAFENGDEYFVGTVLLHYPIGRGWIDVAGEKSGIRCRGEAVLRYTPPWTLVQQARGVRVCDGQKGGGILTCDDGRMLTASYTVDACFSGRGNGFANGVKPIQRFYFRWGKDYMIARNWVAQKAKLDLEPTAELSTGTQEADDQSPVDTEVELEFWRSIKDSDDPDMFRAYLETYPHGVFSTLAKLKIQALNKE